MSDIFEQFWGLFTRLDQILSFWAVEYGVFIYFIIFLIIFCETGLIITPFLPGDSLLFLLGALAGSGLTNVYFIMLVVVSAAFLGDTFNFSVGNYFRGKIKPQNRWIKQKYIHQTEVFFERHGGKSIILARFVPIVRTYAPFVAGMGKMVYFRFMVFNISGAILWALTLVPLGFSSAS